VGLIGVALLVVSTLRGTLFVQLSSPGTLNPRVHLEGDSRQSYLPELRPEYFKNVLQVLSPWHTEIFRRLYLKIGLKSLTCCEFMEVPALRLVRDFLTVEDASGV
jgi:hypothetical protein